MPVERQRVEQFLFHEAQLMDEHRFDEWLALWSEPALYWVPSNRDDLDPAREVSLIYDDWVRLQLRIARLKSGFAHAQEPRSRMRRGLKKTANHALRRVMMSASHRPP